MTIEIRPATAGDQAVIRQMVRAEHLNPLGLDWRRFIVAEDHGRIVGIGQIKPHGHLRELASIVVVPDWQGQGIASLIIRTLLAQETRPIYLMCPAHRESFYIRFGFERVPVASMPAYFRRMHWLAHVFVLLTRLLPGAPHQHEIRIMRREPSQEMH